MTLKIPAAGGCQTTHHPHKTPSLIRWYFWGANGVRIVGTLEKGKILSAALSPALHSAMSIVDFVKGAATSFWNFAVS